MTDAERAVIRAAVAWVKADEAYEQATDAEHSPLVEPPPRAVMAAIVQAKIDTRRALYEAVGRLEAK